MHEARKVKIAKSASANNVCVWVGVGASGMNGYWTEKKNVVQWLCSVVWCSGRGRAAIS